MARYETKKEIAMCYSEEVKSLDLLADEGKKSRQIAPAFSQRIINGQHDLLNIMGTTRGNLVLIQRS